MFDRSEKLTRSVPIPIKDSGTNGCIRKVSVLLELQRGPRQVAALVEAAGGTFNCKVVCTASMRAKTIFLILGVIADA